MVTKQHRVGIEDKCLPLGGTQRGKCYAIFHSGTQRQMDSNSPDIIPTYYRQVFSGMNSNYSS